MTAHDGQLAITQRCFIDEHGRVYLETALGFGLVHTQDMLQAANAIERGLWVPQEVLAGDLQGRFGESAGCRESTFQTLRCTNEKQIQ